MASPKAIVARARERVPLLDHLVRAGVRYKADSGDRLAAAVTYFWFLSLFPILLLVISILGYALGSDAQTQVVDGLGDQLPEGLAMTLGEVLTEAKGPAGIIGVIGLLFAGLGWVDALREAIRTLWHQNVQTGNIVVKKVRDIVVLLGLFVVIGASVTVTGLVTGFSDDVLDVLDLQTGALSTTFTRLLGYALALLADTVLFLYLFTRLSRTATPLKQVLSGAFFGAVGFEVLKVVGGIYVARTTSKGEATYGTFAVVVGLLLFLYLLSRLILFAAVFAVTARGDSDTAPSGTSDAATARASGIPVGLADNHPDEPPTLKIDGAPGPLQTAVMDNPVEHDPEPTPPPARSWSAHARRRPTPPPPRRSSPVVSMPTAADLATSAPEPARPVAPLTAPAYDGPALPATPDAPIDLTPSSDAELDRLRAMFPPARPAETALEKQVVMAARATTFAGGAVIAAVGLYSLRTVARMLPRRH